MIVIHDTLKTTSKIDSLKETRDLKIQGLWNPKVMNPRD